MYWFWVYSSITVRPFTLLLLMVILLADPHKVRPTGEFISVCLIMVSRVISITEGYPLETNSPVFIGPVRLWYGVIIECFFYVVFKHYCISS